MGPTPSRIASAPLQASDIVILALGIDGSIEGEAHDRTSITLPGQQNALAAAIAAVGKPTVLVAVNGGAVDYTEVRHRLPGSDNASLAFHHALAVYLLPLAGSSWRRGCA